MNIEQLVVLEENILRFLDSIGLGSIGLDIHVAIEALYDEAWYPISEAEEMGATSGKQVLLWDGDNPFPTWFQGSYFEGEWQSISGSTRHPTRFKLITKPE